MFGLSSRPPSRSGGPPCLVEFVGCCSGRLCHFIFIPGIALAIPAPVFQVWLRCSVFQKYKEAADPLQSPSLELTNPDAACEESSEGVIEAEEIP